MWDTCKCLYHFVFSLVKFWWTAAVILCVNHVWNHHSFECFNRWCLILFLISTDQSKYGAKFFSPLLKTVDFIPIKLMTITINADEFCIADFSSAVIEKSELSFAIMVLGSLLSLGFCFDIYHNLKCSKCGKWLFINREKARTLFFQPVLLWQGKLIPYRNSENNKSSSQLRK